MVWGRALYIFPSEWGGGLICSDFQRREGGRGFDRFIGNSKGFDRTPRTPPPTRLSFIYAPEDQGSLGYRYRQLEEMRASLWNSFREEYVIWLRWQSSRLDQPLPQIDDLVLVKDVPARKGNGWPVARIIDIQGQPGTPRSTSSKSFPRRSSIKKPQLINRQLKLSLKKKIIVMNLPSIRAAK